LCGILLFSACNSDLAAAAGTQRKVILFVWDGLRPDSVTLKTTPNLWAMSQRGVVFHKNHATYPTFTMMNASSFNTGDFPAKAGFYGNWLWLRPNTLQGDNASKSRVDYNQPVFTEDWNMLTSLNGYYNGQLLLVTRVLQAAQAKGLKTCIVGKSGAAFMFDLTREGYGIDENMVFPESLAAELRDNGYPLPKNTPVMWPGIALASNNGNPTAADAKSFLADGVTLDPTAGTTSIFYGANRYMLSAYLNYILPNKDPDVSVIWFRDPDSTEHLYGPGSAAYRDSLAGMDTMLGLIMSRLKALGISDNTDIMVVSDHGHSTVAGDVSLFPLRDIRSGTVVTTGTNPADGYSVSGDVRLPQLLTDNGIAANVYDGIGCIKDPVMSGILSDGTRVYPTQTDTDGKVCGKGPGYQYNTRSFVVPSPLPEDAVVVSANGGSDYLYVVNKNAKMVKGIVSFLQSREEFGAIFVGDNYGAVPGTFKMSTVNLEMAGRSPDIIVSYNYNENATVQGMKGTEYESMQIYRGMHGSFSPVDVRNTLIASGPDFKSGFHDDVPSGNIDVAPTIAYLFSMNLPNTDGRVLYEAIKNSRAKVSVTRPRSVLTTLPVEGLTFYKPMAVVNASSMIDHGKSSFKAELATSTVKDSTGKSVTYFDYAKALRQ
jgi:predicted AlkP superfamily pyrophosphatase or phosphodiesterase